MRAVSFLPVLREAVASGADIFSKDEDVHPLPAGYRLLAAKVYEKLNR